MKMIINRILLYKITSCFLFFFLMLGIQYSYSQKKNTISNKENNSMDHYNSYIGKPLYEFLLDDRVRKYETFTCFDNRPGVLSGVIVELEDKSQYEVYFDKLLYDPPVNVERNWKFSNVIKETIHKIRFIPSSSVNIHKK